MQVESLRKENRREAIFEISDWDFSKTNERFKATL